MAIQSIVFTSLPNGIHPQRHRPVLSVYVSPRLRPSTRVPLQNFPDFANWPRTLLASDAPFRVEVDGHAVDSRFDGAALDPTLWDKLFEKAPVGPYAFRDLSNRELRSFSATRVAGFIKALYQAVAQASPTAFPPVDTGPIRDLRDLLGPHDRRLFELEQGRRADVEGRARGNNRRGPVDLEAWRTLPADKISADWLLGDPFATREQYWEGIRAAVLAGSVPRDAALDLYEVGRFYNRPEARDAYLPRPTGGPTPAPPPPPDPEFHEYLGFLADHPALLRRLGLVIDLLVDLPDPSGGRIRVIPTLPLRDGNDMTLQPATQFERAGARFQPVSPDASRMRNGFLALEVHDRYEVMDLDVDGSALKLSDFAMNLERVLVESAPAEQDHGQRIYVPERARPDATSVPALRSVGFAVVQRERADSLQQRIAHSKQLDARVGTHDVTLFAADLTRGYRIDVEERDRPGWRSLCRRDVVYTVPGVAPFQVRGVDTPAGPGDEGYVKSASTTETPGKNGPLYLHESLFGWDGWSLTVARPGRAIDDPAGVQAAPPVADTRFPLRVDQAVPPGTLPRLRYGRTYRFRARTVDLAGNSTRVDDPPRAADWVRYVRFDPVVSPALVPRRRYTEGESLRHLVIRSDVGLSAADYAASEAVVQALAGWDHVYAANSQRHVAPPKVAQALAELHGMFDPFVGQGTNHDAGLAIARREEGTFLHTSIVDIDRPGQRLPVAGIQLVDSSRQDTAAGRATRVQALALKLARWQTEQGARASALAEGEYVTHDTDGLALPYLPDPLAVGAALFGLPGTDVAGKPTATSVPFVGAWPETTPFRLVLEEGPPGIDRSRPGVLAVQLPKAWTARVPLSCYLDKRALEVLGIWRLMDAAAHTAQEKAALEGRQWMLTPPEELVLVHAVQHPLAAPSIKESTGYGPERRVGATFAWFAREMYCHSRSTARIDMEAEWTEYLDDLKAPRWTTEDRRGHAFDFPVDPDEGKGDGFIRVGESDRFRRGLRAADGSWSNVQEPSHRAVHEFGDTKRRKVRYTPIATTRFREYFPAAITARRANITATGETVQLDVPNAARPTPPSVQYVVPTFRWVEDRSRRGARTYVRRRIGGLRVYLDRPWWSSGEGELLGVVLRQPSPRRPLPLDRLHADVVLLRLALVASGRFRGELTLPRLRSALGRIEQLDLPRPAMLAAQRVKPVLGEAAAQQVILAALSLGDPREPYVTDWGHDPIWRSGALPASRPAPGHFTRVGVTVGENLTLAELHDASTRGHTVAVVGHEVEWSQARGLWFCDIEIDAGRSYFPFVRLALARYQPHSVANCHLSPVVRADFAQLAAGRALTLTLRTLKLLRVAVAGVGGVNEISESGPASGSPQEFPRRSRRVTAAVERRHPAIAGDLGWETVGDPVELRAPNMPDTEVQWTGEVTLPSALDTDASGDYGPLAGYSSGGRLRIVIREYESLEADPPPIGFLSLALGRMTGERLVYADSVEL